MSVHCLTAHIMEWGTTTVYIMRMLVLSVTMVSSLSLYLFAAVNWTLFQTLQGMDACMDSSVLLVEMPQLVEWKFVS